MVEKNNEQIANLFVDWLNQKVGLNQLQAEK
jgi:hypothetical protein